MKSQHPIGLFDSGIGGTSIWKAIHELMPNENTLYLADSINAPYGDKSKDEIIALSEKNTELLLNQNSKIVVVACNTATTNAISHLRQQYDVPFIGIEPAIKPAALNSYTKTIGVLATKGTINSQLFHQAVLNFTEIKIIEQIGFGLVRLIEQGKINDLETKQLLQEYLSPMIAENIDFLVLGCSHYPYLIPIIEQIIPKSIKIIDSGEAVAKQTKRILKQNHLINNIKQTPQIEFWTNTNPEVLKDILNQQYNVIQKDF